MGSVSLGGGTFGGRAARDPSRAERAGNTEAGSDPRAGDAEAVRTDGRAEHYGSPGWTCQTKVPMPDGLLQRADLRSLSICSYFPRWAVVGPSLVPLFWSVHSS